MLRSRLSASTIHKGAMAVAISLPTTGSPKPSDNKSHHQGQGFKNPWPSTGTLPGLSAIIRARLVGEWRNVDVPKIPSLKVLTPAFGVEAEDRLRATWLGHACFFVQHPGPQGLSVLYDPVFSLRCSPSQWLGPKRVTKIPCEIEDIPHVDIVIISHNHYDHLDLNTIKRLAARSKAPHFFVPMGNASWFHSLGIEGVTELDWWDERDVGIKDESTVPRTGRIGALPCQHIANRWPTDHGKTLWASWEVRSGGKKVYFAGDSGYRHVPKMDPSVDEYAEERPHCPAFEQIGNLRGPYDFAMIPIGAYSPRHIVSSVHCDPYDSVRLFKDIKAKSAVSMHHSTFVLTDEPLLEPPSLLEKALDGQGVPRQDFRSIPIGDSVEI